jgi:hypothetical protein
MFPTPPSFYIVAVWRGRHMCAWLPGLAGTQHIHTQCSGFFGAKLGTVLVWLLGMMVYAGNGPASLACNPRHPVQVLLWLTKG